MPSTTKINLRLFHTQLSEEERQFFGLDHQHLHSSPEWPAFCANTMEPPAGKIQLSIEGEEDIITFLVPISEKLYELKKRNYGWITNTGLWIAYIGVILFFINLYFVFSFNGRNTFDSEVNFYAGAIAIALVFAGFYFTRLMQAFNEKFRLWLGIPGVKAKLIASTPIYRDISFDFSNLEYAEKFMALNDHLLLSNLTARLVIQKEKIEQEIRQDPDNHVLHFEYGLALERSGDFQQAIDSYGRVVQMDKKNAQAFRHLGGALYAVGDYKNAETTLLVAYDIEPENLDSRIMLAALYLSRRDTSSAEKYLKKAVSNGKHDHIVLTRVGELYQRFGYFDKAMELFDSALLNNGHYLDAVIGKSSCLLILNKEEELETYMSSIEDSHPEVYESLALSLQQMQR